MPISFMWSHPADDQMITWRQGTGLACSIRSSFPMHSVVYQTRECYGGHAKSFQVSSDGGKDILFPLSVSASSWLVHVVLCAHTHLWHLMNHFIFNK